MSLLNGISALGSGLSSYAEAGIKDEAARVKAPLLNSVAPPTDAPTAAPDAPKPLPGPRVPDGVNPYGTGPHAAVLWQAERSIVGPESGGRANAQNPVSSAGGLFQIINPTWDAAMRRMGLPVAESDAERNAQKYLPDLNTRVMRQINTDAAAALAAHDLPVNVQTLQAAHRLGPAGATLAVQAAMENPNAPLVGNGLALNAARGNGDISRLTVGQFLAKPYPGSGG